MPVLIPDPLAERIERLAKRRGYDSSMAFMDHLIEFVEIDPHPDFEHRDEIESMLIEGWESGPGQPITPAFWQEMRNIANTPDEHELTTNTP